MTGRGSTDDTAEKFSRMLNRLGCNVGVAGCRTFLDGTTCPGARMFYWTGVSVKGTDCVRRLRFFVSRWCCVFKQLSFADDSCVPYAFMPARGSEVVMMYVDDEETPRRVWRIRPPRVMVINLDVNKRIDVVKMDIDDMREMVAGKSVDVVDI